MPVCLDGQVKHENDGVVLLLIGVISSVAKAPPILQVVYAWSKPLAPLKTVHL